MADEKDIDPTIPAATREGRERWKSAAERSFEKAAVVEEGLDDRLRRAGRAARRARHASPASTRSATSAGRASTRSRAASTRPATAASSGRCASSPASARRAQTNQRFHYLLEHGQTGLSTAFHLPTLYGYDSDHEMARGEVGKCGVAIDSLRRHGGALRRHRPRRGDDVDDDQLDGADRARDVPRGRREARARRWEKVGGTLQNDILKEYIAQKEYIFPPRPSMRLITDQFSFCAKHVPRWNTISISGYHIREAGSTALQELAFTLRDGIEYVEYGIDAGLPTSTSSRRGSRSSSTRTTTSSRRSRSSAPRAASGRRRCASASARRTRAPGCAASTRRRPAAR